MPNVGTLGVGNTANPRESESTGNNCPSLSTNTTVHSAPWANTTPKLTSSDILSSSPTEPHSLFVDSRDSVKWKLNSLGMCSRKVRTQRRKEGNACPGLCDKVLKTSMKTVCFDALEHLVVINTDSQLDNSEEWNGCSQTFLAAKVSKASIPRTYRAGPAVT